MEYLTPEEIAERLRVDISTVRRWLRLGQLKSIRVGRQYRISQADFEAYLKAQEVKVDPKTNGLAAFAH